MWSVDSAYVAMVLDKATEGTVNSRTAGMRQGRGGEARERQAKGQTQELLCSRPYPRSSHLGPVSSSPLFSNSSVVPRTPDTRSQWSPWLQSWTCPQPSLGLSSFLPCSYFKAPLFPPTLISSPESFVKLISSPLSTSLPSPNFGPTFQSNSCSQISRTFPLPPSYVTREHKSFTPIPISTGCTLCCTHYRGAPSL